MQCVQRGVCCSTRCSASAESDHRPHAGGDTASGRQRLPAASGVAQAGSRTRPTVSRSSSNDSRCHAPGTTGPLAASCGTGEPGEHATGAGPTRGAPAPVYADDRGSACWRRTTGGAGIGSDAARCARTTTGACHRLDHPGTGSEAGDTGRFVSRSQSVPLPGSGAQGPTSCSSPDLRHGRLSPGQAS
jgi:hypothetical protein